MPFASSSSDINWRRKKEPLFGDRAVKTEEEIRHVESAQRATEQAVAAAHATLRRAEARNGFLWLDGKQITSESIKKLINVALMECDCVAQHTIVAGGDQACDPHNEGSGPLPADRSIIFDVFPRSAQTGILQNVPHGGQTPAVA